jgi:N-methylhydantoinase B
MKLRTDLGGPGKHRGGLGIERIYTILMPVHYSVMIERTKCPPWGVAGGLAGAPGRAEVYRDGVLVATLLKDDVELRAGDQLRFSLRRRRLR